MWVIIWEMDALSFPEIPNTDKTEVKFELKE